MVKLSGKTNENSRQGMIAGIGSALVDIIVNEDDEFIEKTGVKKGGMYYVDVDFIENLLSLTPSKPIIAPGGSACNTILGAGKLGGPAKFFGQCGNGSLGELFRSALENHNVVPDLILADAPTGRSLSIVTPDAQRTFFTYLGASSEIDPGAVNEDAFGGASVVHVEGYLLFNPDLIKSALSAAKSAGARVSLDLASFNVVEESKELLEEIVDKYVDILIANEDEARVFTGCSDESDAIEVLAGKAEYAALKVGERGSYVAREGNISRIDSMSGAKVIDTIGAGDLWAAGFLHGIANDYPIETCGALGSACGYEVCRVVGANIPESGWDRIRQQFSQIEEA